MNTCCPQLTASGSPKSKPAPPTLPPPTLGTTPVSPFSPSSRCQSAVIEQAFLQTLPLRPVTSSAGRKSEGSSSSCERHTTHIYWIQREGWALRGHGGVESWALLLSHCQTMPHHYCFSHDHKPFYRHLTIIWKWYVLSGNQFNPGVSTSPAANSCNVAMEQWGGRDHI